MIKRVAEAEGDRAETDVRERGPRRRRLLRLSTLPTMLTLGNLVCGFLAISYLADAQTATGLGDASLAVSRMALAGWIILLGMVFDSMDGSVARMTHTTTEFGGALDSLADVVTFGIAPAFLMKVLIQGALAPQDTRLAFLTACFYAACAALRLARYNVEQEDSESPVTDFVGLPTPGAAGVLAAIAVCHEDLLRWLSVSEESLPIVARVLGLGVVAMGMLMVSRVPYAHVANRLLRGRKPIGRLALLLLAVVMVGYLGTEALVLAVFGGYALSGPVLVLYRLLIGRRGEVQELFD